MSDSIERVIAEMLAVRAPDFDSPPAREAIYCWATRLQSLRQVPEYTNEMGDAGDRYIASVSYGSYPLPAQFRWHELWEAMNNPAPPTSGDDDDEAPVPTAMQIEYARGYGDGVRDAETWATERKAMEPTPAQAEPMWPSDPLDALRRIESMGGPASYIARECLRRAGTPAQAGAELPECKHDVYLGACVHCGAGIRSGHAVSAAPLRGVNIFHPYYEAGFNAGREFEMAQQILADEITKDLSSCMAMVDRSPNGSVMYPSPDFHEAAAKFLITHGDSLARRGGS